VKVNWVKERRKELKIEKCHRESTPSRRIKRVRGRLEELLTKGNSGEINSRLTLWLTSQEITFSSWGCLSGRKNSLVAAGEKGIKKDKNFKEPHP